MINKKMIALSFLTCLAASFSSHTTNAAVESMSIDNFLNFFNDPKNASLKEEMANIWECKTQESLGIFMAVRYNSIDAMRYFLYSDAFQKQEKSTPPEQRSTPLHAAALYNRDNMIPELCDVFYVFTANKKNEMPHAIATRHGNLAALEALRSYGRPDCARCKERYVAMHCNAIDPLAEARLNLNAELIPFLPNESYCDGCRNEATYAYFTTLRLRPGVNCPAHACNLPINEEVAFSCNAWLNETQSKRLILVKNGITDSTLTPIARGVGKNSSIEHLEISDQYFSDKGLKELLTSLKEHPTVETLIIGSRNLLNAEQSGLCEFLSEHKTLKTFHLTSHSIDNIFPILDAIYDNTSLTEVTVAGVAYDERFSPTFAAKNFRVSFEDVLGVSTIQLSKLIQ